MELRQIISYSTENWHSSCFYGVQYGSVKSQGIYKENDLKQNMFVSNDSKRLIQRKIAQQLGEKLWFL